MKKLVILAFVLTSCGYNAINNVDKNYTVITDIESGSTNYIIDGQLVQVQGCYYYTNRSTTHRMRQSGYFFDRCGKFTVGDTIKIVKR